jgi:hypothetical protein
MTSLTSSVVSSTGTRSVPLSPMWGEYADRSGGGASSARPRAGTT